MQQDFDANSPELGIHIIGINEYGEESGNPLVDEELSWLQDIDANGDNESDVWQVWDVVYRDVVILNGNNEKVGTFNLTVNNLAEAENYAALRKMFVDAASTDQDLEPPTGVDLLPISDSGTNDSDNRTNFNNISADLALQVRVDGVTDGAIVRLFADGTEIGQAIVSGSEVEITSDGTTHLTDGKKKLTATQEVGGLVSDASPALTVYIDTSIGHFTPLEATTNSLFTYDAQNTDEGETGFSYSLHDAPAGATIEPASGLVSWTPTDAQFGRQHFTVVATDRVGNTRTQYVDVNVGGMAPDFALADVNPTSPAYGQPVSPRDYLEQVSGWYFTYAT